MTDERTIIAANAAFYEAFSTGDIEDLAGLWADDDNISCIHPGWPAIIGRTAVISSWRDLFDSPGRPQIVCQEPYAIIMGGCGHVLCIELVGPAALAASNHFRNINGIWRLVHHQASKIARTVGQVSTSSPGQSRQIH